MGEVTNQIDIVLGVFVACFAGPAAALFVLIRRKAKARQSRRSPIGIALLRAPGHSRREQLDEAHNDLTRDLLLSMVVPLLALALFLAQSHLRGLPQLAHLAPVYALAAIAFIARMLRKRLEAGTRLDHLKAGDDAAVAVGQELDQLMRQGAATFHDLPAWRSSIDHVGLAAEGVFAIETKPFAKPNQGRGPADATVVDDVDRRRQGAVRPAASAASRLRGSPRAPTSRCSGTGAGAHAFAHPPAAAARPVRVARPGRSSRHPSSFRQDDGHMNTSRACAPALTCSVPSRVLPPKVAFTS